MSLEEAGCLGEQVPFPARRAVGRATGECVEVGNPAIRHRSGAVLRVVADPHRAAAAPPFEPRKVTLAQVALACTGADSPETRSAAHGRSPAATCSRMPTSTT